jgi:hypothetical protein
MFLSNVPQNSRRWQSATNRCFLFLFGFGNYKNVYSGKEDSGRCQRAANWITNEIARIYLSFAE